MGILTGLIIMVIGLKVGAYLLNASIMASLTPEERAKQKAFDKYIKDGTK